MVNWAEYEAGLRAPGSLTVWFTQEAVEGWRAAPRTTSGGQLSYSDLSIATALTLRAVFHLMLRKTQGLTASIPQLLDSISPSPTIRPRTAVLRRSRCRGHAAGKRLCACWWTARD
ncbi:transposase [Muricoccus aerilatus]|uniref:transposase n=1 Tax=Muricoccus aerilatus TaxID=452982 RepID=UPI001B80A429